MSLSRALSVDLRLIHATKDFMTVFIDCLVLLPNLTTLDVFIVDDISHAISGLERKCARFPNIRELWAHGVSVVFVRSCPNVESVTTTGIYPQGVEVLCTHGKKLKRLKRVAGVPKEYIQQGELSDTFYMGYLFTESTVMEVVRVWPDLREIGIKDTIGTVRTPVVSPQRRELPGLMCLSLLHRLIPKPLNTSDH